MLAQRLCGRAFSVPATVFATFELVSSFVPWSCEINTAALQVKKMSGCPQ
jgi:hypothetical protein